MDARVQEFEKQISNSEKEHVEGNVSVYVYTHTNAHQYKDICLHIERCVYTCGETCAYTQIDACIQVARCSTSVERHMSTRRKTYVHMWRDVRIHAD